MTKRTCVAAHSPWTVVSIVAFLIRTLLVEPTLSQAQFTYTTNSGTLTLAKYTGVTNIVAVPEKVGDLLVTRIGDSAFAFRFGLLGVTLPGTIVSIGDSAFSYCTSLTNVNIPAGVTNLGTYAFLNCSSLPRIVIPGSASRIGDLAFSFCASLNAIDVDPLNQVYTSVDGVLLDHSSTRLITYPQGRPGPYTIPGSVTEVAGYAFYTSAVTDLTIPSAVSVIGEFAFARSALLNAVTLPNGLTHIGNGWFSSCGALTKISIPSGVTSIDDYAFYLCTNLAAITLPKGLTNIGATAFSTCSSLTSLTIPKGVTTLGDQAFQNCTNLNALYFEGNAPTAASLTFSGDTKTFLFYSAGATGWSAALAGRPAVLWNARISSEDPNFGVSPAGFGFTLIGGIGWQVVVETCTNLANPVWEAVSTNILVNGLSAFADPGPSQHTARYYRLRTP